VACIGAGVFWLAGMVATPWENGHNDLAATLNNLGRAEVAPVFLHFGFMLVVPACIGLAWLAARRAPILAAVTVVLAVLGSSMSGFLAMDFYDLAVAQSLPLSQATAIADKVGSFPSAMIILLPSIFALLLAMAGATLAAWKAGLVPVWLVIVMTAAVLYGQLFSKGYALPSIGSSVVICYAFLHLAYAVLRSSSTAAAASDRSAAVPA
jgi:hypothetical protein